ncbi:hypothetical protein ACQ4M4_11405 [Leptolyngbya sp. AN02str]|uniref:hypothetical protein n=1 Tax=Leptolyngbya sp. AN02str TaxID=3423363 RepID=UPI003D31BCAB
MPKQRSRTRPVPVSLDDVAARMLEAPAKACDRSAAAGFRGVVAKLYDAIQKMRGKGYSLQDVCDFLAEVGIADVRPGTLSSYLSLEKKRRTEQSDVGVRVHKPVIAPVVSSVAELSSQPAASVREEVLRDIEAIAPADSEVPASTSTSGSKKKSRFNLYDRKTL